MSRPNQFGGRGIAESFNQRAVRRGSGRDCDFSSRATKRGFELNEERVSNLVSDGEVLSTESMIFTDFHPKTIRRWQQAGIESDIGTFNAANSLKSCHRF